MRIGFTALQADEGTAYVVNRITGLLANAPSCSHQTPSHDGYHAPLELIAAPPLQESAISFPILNQVDRIVLVVEAVKNTLPRVEYTVDMLRQGFENKLIGVVLNKRRLVIPQCIYRWLGH